MLDAYIVGHGVPELAAALELAEVGLRVRVALPAADVVSEAEAGAVSAAVSGAAAAAAEGAGSAAHHTAPDRGALDHDGAIRALLDHAAAPIADGHAFEPAAPVAGVPGRTLVHGANGGWVPLPEPNVWGIPAVPMSSDSIAVLGGRGSLRATVDRVRPVLTIGKTQGLGALVRSRMGQQMLDRAVNPLVRERYGVDANEVDAAVAAPGLNGALTVSGSLSGAALIESEAHLARETAVLPAGGWAALRDVLLQRLELYGVQFGAAVAEVQPLPESAGAPDNPFMPHFSVTETDGASFEAVAVVSGVSARSSVRPAAQADAAPVVPVVWRPSLTAVVTEAELPDELVSAAAAANGPAGGGTVAAGSGTNHAAAPQPRVTAIAATSEGWSVRYDNVDAGLWRVTATGPAGEAEASDQAGIAAARREISVLRHAPSVWRLAPWARLADHAAAADALDTEREEAPWSLRVGEGLHAGDLSAAIADARRAAVLLRRRLTGISD